MLVHHCGKRLVYLVLFLDKVDNSSSSYIQNWKRVDTTACASWFPQQWRINESKTMVHLNSFYFDRYMCWKWCWGMLTLLGLAHILVGRRSRGCKRSLKNWRIPVVLASPLFAKSKRRYSITLLTAFMGNPLACHLQTIRRCRVQESQPRCPCSTAKTTNG